MFITKKKRDVNTVKKKIDGLYYPIKQKERERERVQKIK